jgi:hypothetical protein
MAAQSSALGDEQQARCHTHPRIKLNPTEGNPAMTNSMQIGKVVHTFIDAYGFDPTHIYCQVTGKPIAQTHSEEFEALVDSLGVVDAEQAADDLAVRLLASMRPSMRWNVFRDDSLVIMRQKHPVETLAYLLNRMFAPLNFRKISRRDLLADLEHRIKTFQIISEWDKASHFDTLIYMLLELDAKWSLDTESAPFNWQDFFVTADTMDARVDLLQQWYNRRVADWDKKQKADEMQTRWMRSGSALAKPAYMAEFLAAKPLSKSAAVRESKKEEKAFFAGLLSEILMGRVDDEEEKAAITPNPALVVRPKGILKFGVK